MRKTMLTIGLLAAPRAALACPVCFGNSDSPMAIAMNMGIIVMLVVVAGVLGGFASFFIYLMRRAKRVAEQTDPGETGRYVPSEGPAQC
jgi:hypothetical protein